MTERLYLTDAYLREFDATVTRVEAGGGVVLDRTAFYPGGGGQPPDRGFLTDGSRTWEVVRLENRPEEVVHYVAGEPPAAGSRVRGVIDWELRYRLMRTHTALHILCGVVYHEFGATVTGTQMYPDRARMDFTLEDLNPERVRLIELKCNEAVARALPVEVYFLPREEALKNLDLIRTRVNLIPEHIKEIRVVDIKGLDLQADGGTHVRNTAEVKGIKVVRTENKGRFNRRLEIVLVD